MSDSPREFSRRVNVQTFKDEPLTREEYDTLHGPTEESGFYEHYLETFQPFRWHAVGANNEIVAQGESYLHEDGCANAIELLFADNTTVYVMPMYGENRGERLLRYGSTDRNAQVDDSPEQAEQ
jgi:uncharacterized protein YegP (UPF0339 family)